MDIITHIHQPVSYGAEAWTLTKKEEEALLIFERKIFRRINSPKYENGEWKSRTNRKLEAMSKGENIVKWIKGQRISWLGHLERMEEDRMSKRSSLKKWKGQEEGEDPGKYGKRSSSPGSEKMERAGGRWEKMEGHCSTRQSPQCQWKKKNIHQPMHTIFIKPQIIHTHEPSYMLQRYTPNHRKTLLKSNRKYIQFTYAIL